MDDALFHQPLGKEGWLYGPTPGRGEGEAPRHRCPRCSSSSSTAARSPTRVRRRPRLREHPSLHAANAGLTDESLRKDGRFKKLDYLALEKAKVTGGGLEAGRRRPAQAPRPGIL